MTKDARRDLVAHMMGRAQDLAREDDPVLAGARPRIVAILHEVRQLRDLEYEAMQPTRES